MVPLSHMKEKNNWLGTVMFTCSVAKKNQTPILLKGSLVVLIRNWGQRSITKDPQVNWIIADVTGSIAKTEPDS
jgi:hypothetical protein